MLKQITENEFTSREIVYARIEEEHYRQVDMESVEISKIEMRGRIAILKIRNENYFPLNPFAPLFVSQNKQEIKSLRRGLKEIERTCTEEVENGYMKLPVPYDAVGELYRLRIYLTGKAKTKYRVRFDDTKNEGYQSRKVFSSREDAIKHIEKVAGKVKLLN